MNSGSSPIRALPEPTNLRRNSIDEDEGQAKPLYFQGSVEMTPKLILLFVLSSFLSFSAVFMLVQSRLTGELLIVAIGAITGWSTLVCHGRLPGWLKTLWGDRITEDSDPTNLPVRIWLPLSMLAIIIASALIWY